MRLGASLFLFALGAILTFAVTDTLRSVDLGVIGVVLMIVGAIGLLAETIMWGSRRRTDLMIRDDRAVDDPYGPPRY